MLKFMFTNTRSMRRIATEFLKSNTKGVAAVEFALILPILILLFVGTMEISRAVSVDRKISRVSSSVADLITQGESFNRNSLQALTDISSRIMHPYNNTVSISIVGVSIDAGGNASVAWSYGRDGGVEPAPGAAFTVPAAISTPNTFLISSSISTSHAPAFSFINYAGGNLTLDGSAINLEEQMFLRPRLSGDIDCTDC